MEQKLNTKDAAVKDARIKLRKEECVSGMEQHGRNGCAAAKDARILLTKEECA